MDTNELIGIVTPVLPRDFEKEALKMRRDKLFTERMKIDAELKEIESNLCAIRFREKEEESL